MERLEAIESRELYNLKNDPNQQLNVYDENQELFKS